MTAQWPGSSSRRSKFLLVLAKAGVLATPAFLLCDNLVMTLDQAFKLTDKWKDPFGPPIIKYYGRVAVVRDDILPAGSKARFADFFVSKIENDHLVYAAPRVGYASISLAWACSRYGKKLTVIVPAAKMLSDYQFKAFEYGAYIRSLRIAAMPNLERAAEGFAQEAKAFYVPMGLHHTFVHAAIVRVAAGMEAPDRAVTAIGSGVLTRGLQKAWTKTEFIGVSVGRSLDDGEAGHAFVMKYPKPFLWETKCEVPFPCIASYDAKAWELAINLEVPSLFWNVAGPVKIKNTSLQAKIKVDRAWGDHQALNPRWLAPHISDYQ